METEARRERWEQASDWPLIVAALLFLGAFAWPAIDPGLSQEWRRACWAVTWLTWVVFALDYGARLVLSRDRWRFVRGHPFDLLVVALPLLRPLALLRLLGLLGVVNRRAGHAFHGRVAMYVATTTSLLVFVGALVVLRAERGEPGAVITSFGDALWWAVATVTTVGYGDEYPVTTSGRVFAGGLMFAGIALLGVVTAAVASWLIRRVAKEEEEIELATQRDVAALAAEVAALRAEIRLLGTPSRSGSTPPE